MKRLSYPFALLFLLTATAPALAQSGHSLQPHPISDTLDSWIANTETHVVPVGNVMPEARYSFAPTSRAGEFQGVRTFAEQLKHLAANNYRVAAVILGERPTADMDNETGPEGVRTKTEIMEYVKGSFAALHKAAATIDEQNLVQPLASNSQWQKTRLSFVVDAVAHCFDHYGQLVEYLRMNGIIPPDSQPAKPSK